MRSLTYRVCTFLLAGIISFCATIAPAYALTSSFAGLPSINAIIQGTIGTFVDTSTGVTITRSAVAIAEGVSIPFTVAETATFAEIAAGTVAAGLASPAGFAAAAIAVAAGFYLWHKCTQAASGWCKDLPSTVTVGAGHYWINGDAQPQFTSPGAACSSKGYGYIIASTSSSYYCNISGDGNNNYTGSVASMVTGTCLPGFTPGPNDTCIGQASNTITMDTAPALSPEAKSLTERAMAENKMRPSVFADAAQKDGHPVDDPKVNPQLPTTVSSPTANTAPTAKVETAPDGTKTTTTCNGTASLGVSGPGNDTATLTKGGATNCTTVAVSPDGTIKTGTTTTTDGQKPGAAAGPVECGSPGRAKCAIDETGTPTDAPADVDFSKHKQTYDDAATAYQGVTQSSIGVSNWLPTIATNECVNPQVPNPISHEMKDVPVCGAFNVLKTFISSVICVFALYGCIREVQSAMKA